MRLKLLAVEKRNSELEQKVSPLFSDKNVFYSCKKIIYFSWTKPTRMFNLSNKSSKIKLTRQCFYPSYSRPRNPRNMNFIAQDPVFNPVHFRLHNSFKLDQNNPHQFHSLLKWGNHNVSSPAAVFPVKWTFSDKFKRCKNSLDKINELFGIE